MLTAAHPFGELLDQIMADHDLTQSELADRLGYSQGWIPQVRNGRKPPAFSMAGRIAREFPEHDVGTVYGLIDDARRRLGYADETFPGLFFRLRYPSRPTIFVWPTSPRTVRTFPSSLPAVA